MRIFFCLKTIATSKVFLDVAIRIGNSFPKPLGTGLLCSIHGSEIILNRFQDMMKRFRHFRLYSHIVIIENEEAFEDCLIEKPLCLRRSISVCFAAVFDKFKDGVEIFHYLIERRIVHFNVMFDSGKLLGNIFLFTFHQIKRNCVVVSVLPAAGHA